MSDRVAFYDKQRVSETELNLPFELLEKADHNLAADIGIYGIVSGAEPAQHEPVADLSIDLAAPGRAYDRIGQRIFFGVAQNVNLARDTAGVSTQVMTAGRERWLAVFLRFKRLLSDERTDGNSQRIFFRQDESFEIVVRQSAESAAGTAVRVPLEDDEILVCDVRRAFGVDRILREHIDLSRRQALVSTRSDSVGVDAELWHTIKPPAPTVQSALDEVDKRFAAHVGGQADKHAARDVTLAPTGFVTAQTVQAGFSDIAQKLAAPTGGSPGAELIGADAVPGTPRAMGAGTVNSQLSTLLAYLNEHLSAASAAHAAAAIRALPHNWLTTESVQAQLQELVAGLRADRIAATAYRHLQTTTVQAQLKEFVDNLRSTAANDGTALISGAAIDGSPRSINAGTLFAQLSAIVDQLNAHAGAGDHDSRYARRIFAGAADVASNETHVFTNLAWFPDFVQVAFDLGTAVGWQRWYRGAFTENMRVWVDKNQNTGVMRLMGENRNNTTIHMVVAAYMVG